MHDKDHDSSLRRQPEHDVDEGSSLRPRLEGNEGKVSRPHQRFERNYDDDATPQGLPRLDEGADSIPPAEGAPSADVEQDVEFEDVTVAGAYATSGGIPAAAFRSDDRRSPLPLPAGIGRAGACQTPTPLADVTRRYEPRISFSPAIVAPFRSDSRPTPAAPVDAAARSEGRAALSPAVATVLRSEARPTPAPVTDGGHAPAPAARPLRRVQPPPLPSPVTNPPDEQAADTPEAVRWSQVGMIAAGMLVVGAVVGYSAYRTWSGSGGRSLLSSQRSPPAPSDSQALPSSSSAPEPHTSNAGIIPPAPVGAAPMPGPLAEGTGSTGPAAAPPGAEVAMPGIVQASVQMVPPSTLMPSQAPSTQVPSMPGPSMQVSATTAIAPGAIHGQATETRLAAQEDPSTDPEMRTNHGTRGGGVAATGALNESGLPKARARPAASAARTPASPTHAPTAARKERNPFEDPLAPPED